MSDPPSLDPLLEQQARARRKALGFGLGTAAVLIGMALAQRGGMTEETAGALWLAMILPVLAWGVWGIASRGGPAAIRRETEQRRADTRARVQDAVEPFGLASAVDWTGGDPAFTTLRLFATAPFAIAVGRREDARHCLTGDAAFDRGVGAAGEDGPVLACLDAATRARARELAKLGTLRQQGNCLEIVCGGLHHGDEAAAIAASLLALARACLVPVEEVPAALAVRAAEDPDPGVRERAARVLFRQHPSSAPARSLSATWLEGDDPDLALLAAQELGRTDLVSRLLEARAAARGGLTLAAVDGALSPAGDAGALAEEPAPRRASDAEPQ